VGQKKKKRVPFTNGLPRGKLSKNARKGGSTGFGNRTQIIKKLSKKRHADPSLDSHRRSPTACTCGKESGGTRPELKKKATVQTATGSHRPVEPIFYSRSKGAVQIQEENLGPQRDDAGRGNRPRRGNATGRTAVRDVCESDSQQRARTNKSARQLVKKNLVTLKQEDALEKKKGPRGGGGKVPSNAIKDLGFAVEGEGVGYLGMRMDFKGGCLTKLKQGGKPVTDSNFPDTKKKKKRTKLAPLGS